MTREEAKGNLIHAIRWNDMPKKEALDMTIKARDGEISEITQEAGVRIEALTKILEAKEA